MPKFNNYKFKGEKKAYDPIEQDVEKFKYKDASKPEKGEYDENSLGMSYDTIKHLRYFHDSITVKANPDGLALPSAVPYAVINKTNRIINANYGEKENSFGNILQQVISNEDSSLLYRYDAGRFDLKINYLYLDVNPVTDNEYPAATIQMKKTIDDAISKSYSETFIDLPFFSYYLNECTIAGIDVKDDAQSADLLLGTAVTYQSVLQGISGAFNKFNQLLASQTLASNMCWNRESPIVEKLWGLYRKAAFISNWKALADNIKGEYFDREWYLQTNMLTALLSRKADALTEPVLEVTGTHNIPKCIIYAAKPAQGADPVEVFNSEHTFKVKTSLNEESDLTIGQILTQINDCLSFEDNLKFIRSSNPSPRTRFNKLDWLLDGLVLAMAYFKKCFGTFRTVLDIMNRVGINGWTHSPVFSVIQTNNYQPEYNVLVADIYRSYCSAVSSISLDETTLRWKTFSIWNAYYGVPKYDRMQNGAFITFSTRDLDYPGASIAKTNLYLVPRMFRPIASPIKFLNRLGTERVPSFGTKTGAQLKLDLVYARYLFIDHAVSGMNIRYPQTTVNVTEINAALCKDIAAYQCLMQQLFGMAEIKVINTTTEEADTLKSCSNDDLGFLDIEIDNLQNNMITFIAARSPFRTVTIKDTDYIGFKTLK